METLFNSWFESIINSITSGLGSVGIISDIFDWGSSKLLAKAFDVPSQLGSIGTQMDKLSTVVLTLAITLIVIKFVFKGFNTYVLWIDENADADPFNTLINFGKALIIAFCFGYLYSMIADVVISFGNQLLEVIKIAVTTDMSANSFSTALLQATVNNGNLLYLVFAIIYLILYLILYFRIIMMGIELWILKIGIPLACIGIIDGSQDLWKSFMNKFWQVCLTIIVQVVLQYLSLMLLLDAHLIYSIATLILSMSTPNLLREFMYAPGGMNMNAVLHNSQMIGRSVSMIAKKIK